MVRPGWGVTLVAVVACGRPKNEPADATPDMGSSKTLQVATTGDDANDGITEPVKTLKRAIALARVDGSVTAISLAQGRYDASNGETFPYTVPGDVTIFGPTGGGAILAGSGAEAGLMLATGALENVEMESFMLAIDASGTATISGIQLRTSDTAILARTSAHLMVDHLDITGAAGSPCQTGVVLIGGATVMADTVASRALGSTVEMGEQSALTLANGMIAGAPACHQPDIYVESTGQLTMSSTVIEGGQDGVWFGGPTPAVFTDVTIRDMDNDGIVALVGGNPTFTMTGGEISNHARAALEATDGTWFFTDVTMQGNGISAILMQGALHMQHCQVVRNTTGVSLFNQAVADLGTVATPGRNTFQDNQRVGVEMGGDPGRLITAVGNTWNAGVQDADSAGGYVVATVNGPVSPGLGANFSIESGWSLQR
jgi:Protein of unknown function (DUF1565)/Right handed beta helix region